MLVKASSQQKIIASSKKNIYKDLRQKEQKKGTKKNVNKNLKRKLNRWAFQLKNIFF